MNRLKQLIHSEQFVVSMIIFIGLLLNVTRMASNDFHIGVYDDSGSYFTSGDVIASGHIDHLRTPVYPLLCHFLASITAANTYKIIVILQLLFYMSSAVPMYYAVRKLTHRKRFATIATACYTWSPIFGGYIDLIFTESFSISCTTYIMALLTAIVLSRHKIAATIASATFLVFMIMLRPFFLCFIPATLIVMLYALFKSIHNKRYVTICVASIIGVGAILFGYTAAYNKVYGSYSFTSVSELNRCLSLKKMQLIPTIEGLTYFGYATQEDIHGEVIFMPESWVWQPSPQYRQMCENIYHDNFIQYVKLKFIDFLYSFLYEYTGEMNSSVLESLFHLRLAYFYMFAFIFILTELYYLFRRRVCVIMSASLALMFVGGVFTTIWGADSQFVRIMTPMLPCLFVMIPIFCTRLSFNIKQTEKP
ncbi:MAG: hypothetical protein ACI4BH_05455 [Muribaculaceae bacterium]